MKRREIKFVAGALPLAPDRIAGSLRKPPAGRKDAGSTRTAGAAPRTGTAARKRRR